VSSEGVGEFNRDWNHTRLPVAFGHHPVPFDPRYSARRCADLRFEPFDHTVRDARHALVPSVRGGPARALHVRLHPGNKITPLRYFVSEWYNCVMTEHPYTVQLASRLEHSRMAIFANERALFERPDARVAELRKQQDITQVESVARHRCRTSRSDASNTCRTTCGASSCSSSIPCSLSGIVEERS
jgi:hypothetical protein